MTNMTDNNAQVISMDKQYKTREGRNVRVLCTDAKHDLYPVLVLIDRGNNEITESYTVSGSYYSDDSEHKNDLIEVTPFAEFKEGDKVMVRDHDPERWVPRFFKQTIKHHNQVFPCTYEKDYNPWSNVHDNRPVQWLQCRFPTEEELNGSK